MPESNGGEPTVVVDRRSGGGIGLFLLGLAVGAGIALLYAPQSGEETRAELRRGARKIRRKVRDLAEDTSDAAHHLSRSARDTARETREMLERRLARHQRAGVTDEDEDIGV
ncbi:MAG: YtxH domain-containing protein [Gemmatimonadaceae bacterium]